MVYVGIWRISEFFRIVFAPIKKMESEMTDNVWGEESKLTWANFRKNCPSRFRKIYCTEKTDLCHCKREECLGWYVLVVLAKWKGGKVRLPNPVDHEKVRGLMKMKANGG